VLNFLTIIKIVTKDLYKFFENLLNCCYFVKETFIEIFRKIIEKLLELIEFFEKIDLINGHPLVVWPKTGSKLGLLGPKRCLSCQIHQNCVFSVVLIGLYDPKTGSTLGLSGPKWGHNWVVVPLTLNHVQIWVISPKTGSYHPKTCFM
jgi:hypothetical protein